MKWRERRDLMGAPPHGSKITGLSGHLSGCSDPVDINGVMGCNLVACWPGVTGLQLRSSVYPNSPLRITYSN